MADIIIIHVICMYCIELLIRSKKEQRRQRKEGFLTDATGQHRKQNTLLKYFSGYVL